MIILDTNVVSEVMRAEPTPKVLAWLDAQLDTDCFLTAITAAELLFGVERLPDGARKAALAQAVAGMIDVDFQERVLPFDHIAAAHFAEIAALREKRGRPISNADAQIAAICRAHHARLATRNTSDFADLALDITNPWD